MWLFAAFIAVPLIEIGLFIQVGGLLGLWPTLAIVLITALIGSHLVRHQGKSALQDLQSSISTMRDPSAPLAHGAMILFSGALLLTPGFFTDAVGFALLIPRFRKILLKQLRKQIKVQSFSTQSGAAHFHQSKHSPYAKPDIIEGDAVDVTKDER